MSLLRRRHRTNRGRIRSAGSGVGRGVGNFFEFLGDLFDAFN